jgi:hypothetical protein
LGSRIEKKSTLLRYVTTNENYKKIKSNVFNMLSKEFLTERGHCCGNGCFMCPYSPRHLEHNTKLMSKEEWEKHRSKSF